MHRKKNNYSSYVSLKTTAFMLLFLFVLAGCSSFKKRSDLQGFKELIEKENLKFKHTFHEANKEKLLGNYELALELFLQCIKINPLEADPYFQIAGLFDYMGKTDRALSFAKEAVKRDQSNVWYKILYADLLKRNRQYNQAAEVYEDLVKQYPSKVEYYYELAALYLNLQNLSGALQTFEKAEALLGFNEELIVQKQKIFMAMNKPDKAIAEVQKLIDSNPNDVRYLSQMAELYQNLNEQGKAKELFDKIVKIEPDNAFVLLSLSEFYKNKGDKQKSFEYLERAFLNQKLEVDHKVKILLNYYVITETDSALKPNAYKLLDALVKANPDNAKSYSIYGDFLYRDNKFIQAREQFRKAVKLESDKFAIWNQILAIDAELEDYNAMAQESEQVMALFPTQSFVYLYNGVANMQLNNNEKSIESFENGMNLVVDNNLLLVQFYANLGDVYHKLKQHEKSDNYYDKALSIEPENVLVLNNYSYYLAIRGEKFEKAEQMSKKSNDLAPNNSNLQDTYAWVLYKMGKYENAKKWLEMSMQNGGNSSAAVIEHYADALFKLNEKEKAYEYWIKAKETGKGSEFLERKIQEKQLIE